MVVPVLIPASSSTYSTQPEKSDECWEPGGEANQSSMWDFANGPHSEQAERNIERQKQRERDMQAREPAH